MEEKQHLLRPPRMAPAPEAQLKVVDYLFVPRYRSQQQQQRQPAA